MLYPSSAFTTELSFEALHSFVVPKKGQGKNKYRIFFLAIIDKTTLLVRLHGTRFHRSRIVALIIKYPPVKKNTVDDSFQSNAYRHHDCDSIMNHNIANDSHARKLENGNAKRIT